MASLEPIRRFRSRLAPTVVAGVILTDAFAATLLLRADENQVWFLGRPISWVCAIRTQFGVPCPTCGLTRSVVLSLHGEFLRAWNVAPAGPVAVIGVLLFALALLLATWTGRIGSTATVMRRAVLAYGGATTVVWLAGWAFAFHAALRH